MPITTCVPKSYAGEALQGVHAAGDVYKIALYTNAATLNADTAAYSVTNEVAGTGYTAGGKTLTGYTPGAANNTNWLDFADPVWSASSITARGALIYNSSKSNKAVLVLDFGADVVSSSGNFTVQFPAPAETTALLRATV